MPDYDAVFRADCQRIEELQKRGDFAGMCSYLRTIKDRSAYRGLNYIDESESQITGHKRIILESHFDAAMNSLSRTETLVRNQAVVLAVSRSSAQRAGSQSEDLESSIGWFASEIQAVERTLRLIEFIPENHIKEKDYALLVCSNGLKEVQKELAHHLALVQKEKRDFQALCLI